MFVAHRGAGTAQNREHTHFATIYSAYLVAQEVADEAEVGGSRHHDVEHENPRILPALQGLVHSVARVRADVLVRLWRLE